MAHIIIATRTTRWGAKRVPDPDKLWLMLTRITGTTGTAATELLLVDEVWAIYTVGVVIGGNMGLFLGYSLLVGRLIVLNLVVTFISFPGIVGGASVPMVDGIWTPYLASMYSSWRIRSDIRVALVPFVALQSLGSLPSSNLGTMLPRWNGIPTTHIKTKITTPDLNSLYKLSHINCYLTKIHKRRWLHFSNAYNGDNDRKNQSWMRVLQCLSDAVTIGFSIAPLYIKWLWSLS